jgi:outer membrane protein
MKNLLEIAFKIIVICGFAVVIVLQMDEKPKIVYVDSIKLVKGYKGMQIAKKELETRITGYQANLDTLRDELENKISNYEKSKTKMSLKEKSLMEELIQLKQSQYTEYQKAVTEKTTQLDKELSLKVLGQVNDYIKNVGEKKGYQIIMAATQYGNIVYANKDQDITEEILAGLNQQQQ